MSLFNKYPDTKKMEARKDIEGLIKTLGYQKDQANIVQGNAASALGRIGDARAVEPLIAKLKESNYYVRMSVVEALGQVGDARAIEPLIAIFADKDYRIREAAVKALKQIGNPQALAAIKEWDESRIANFPAELKRVLGDPQEIQAAYKGESDNPYIIEAIRNMVEKRKV
jgi:HEAT repeat protein